MRKVQFASDFADIVVGLIEDEDYRCGIEEIMDSIQYEKLNKYVNSLWSLFILKS